ncbi:MAG: RagB/SusD family nutrient uptake outer membrane protein [Gemmatimonadaceae bacterium]
MLKQCSVVAAGPGAGATDLVRFGKFTGSSYIWAWKSGVAAGKSSDALYNLYPIPANELVANPNLKQNAGY